MSELDILEADAVIEEASSTKRSKRPLPTECYACKAQVVGPYCYSCGQKNDDCRRSILMLGWEGVADLFTLDGRVFRTLGSVITRPGKHIREYGDGRRSPYSPPVRFFLIITAIFFTTLWLTDTYLLTLRPDIQLNEDGTIESMKATGGILQSAAIEPYPDEVREAIRKSVGLDTEDVLTINNRKISAESLLENAISIAENPTAFNNVLNDWIPRLMIILIPLMAILGAVFIRGRDALIYDHLLVALNTHAIAFLILTVGLWTAAFLPREIMGVTFFVGVPVFYVAATKGAFRRGWIKTLLGALFVFLIYGIVLMISLSLAAFASFTATI